MDKLCEREKTGFGRPLGPRSAQPRLSLFIDGWLAFFVRVGAVCFGVIRHAQSMPCMIYLISLSGLVHCLGKRRCDKQLHRWLGVSDLSFLRRWGKYDDSMRASITPCDKSCGEIPETLLMPTKCPSY